MGDPLSVSASVAGLISLGLQTTQQLYKYYTTYRSRDEDLARLADRFNDLHQSLAIIDNTIQTRKWRPNEQKLLQHIETSITHCDEVISELQDEARKCQKEPGDTINARIKDFGRRAAYPFRKSTLKKLDEDVTDFRDNLSTVLQALELEEHRHTHDTLQEIKHILGYAQAQHLTADVRHWLRAPDASIDFNAACAKRHANTGQWFVRSDAFTNWLVQDNSFRWLYGFAGCGKSVLCATTIQYTFRQQQSHIGSAVAFFFFTFTDDSKQDASAMLRALLSQLSGQVRGLEADLARLKESYNRGTPPVPVLAEYLRQAVMRAPNVYLLIDALDESPVDSSRAEVLAVLETIRSWSLPGLHLLVTSRDVPDIRDILQHSDHDQSQDFIALRNISVQEDIRQYISYQIENDYQLRRWGDHRETIKDYLTQHADGVFRWVDCQLGPLRQCAHSETYLKRCLSTLPRTLDATYEQMLSRIGEESREDAQRMLSLLCLSARPLSVCEVIEALAVDISNLKCYDKTRKFEGADDLHRVCPGLIEIIDRNVHGRKSVIDESDTIGKSIVRIAHFSVQEYLVSNRIKQNPDVVSFAVSGPAQHLQISETCVIYLLRNDFLHETYVKDLDREYPLARYAARYWHDHYKQTDTLSTWQLTERATVLMTSDNSLSHWIHMYDPERMTNKIYPSLFLAKRIYPSIYYASLLGLDKIVVNILSKPCTQVNARGGFYGNALLAASIRGHGKVVKILLEAGADIKTTGGAYGDALQAASLRSHETVVHVLLEAGADVNAQGGDYGNALQAASEQGHENVVKILLEAGANVNAQGGDYGNALQAASRRGRSEIVQMLIDAGADVNAQAELLIDSKASIYESALYAASSAGHEQVVRKLLDAGANVNVPGGPHGNALQAASESGHENVVQMLLEASAHVNAVGGRYGNALQAASMHGRENVVKILLEAGADINATGGFSGSALHAASGHGHVNVVQTLLNAGADVNSTGGPWDETALQLASSGGYNKVVQILLDAGAYTVEKTGQLTEMPRVNDISSLYGCKHSID